MDAVTSHVQCTKASAQQLRISSPRLTIETEVTVDKIIMSKDSGELSAIGVATVSKAGKKIEYQARKEIIVTAGAYCSPPILMRSGLGPKEQLKKHSIECLVDLPGVGSNLQDHVVCPILPLLPTSADS